MKFVFCFFRKKDFIMSNTYMSVKDKAKAIRTALKEKYGITSRQVSVRGRYCGYSEAIDVEIKDYNIPALITEIEKIANEFESIRYDEHNGEILAGANTYVNVSYNDEMIERESKKYIPLAKKIIQSCHPPIDNGKLIASNVGWERFYYQQVSSYAGQHEIYICAKNDNLKFADILKSRKSKSCFFTCEEGLTRKMLEWITIYKLFDLNDFKIKE